MKARNNCLKENTTQPAAHSPGTRVEIKDLFYATPARLKFLKTPRTELGHISEAIKRLAMSHPNIGLLTASFQSRDFTLGAAPRHVSG